MERLHFIHHAAQGQVEVDVVANTDPPSLGCNEDNLQFPACTAKVRYGGGGYNAMFGWVQLVRSTDATTIDFEMDQYLFFPTIDMPYCFYGHKPTLFDAPGRTHRNDMDWIAHSFLAATPTEYGSRQVTPLQGFSWGFSIRGRAIRLAPVLPLSPHEWVSHLPYLDAEYPNWHFDPVPRWGDPEG
ncbi:MAG: hypothetical protein QOK10_1111 [Pseudonocardiales bacterium]|jgi:hypothetical protein|nr:hypothetical protein [Pseudonocardiales bacterium]